MDVVRYQNRSTSENLDAILNRLWSPGTILIRLFATIRDTEGMGVKDGSEVNLPLLHALVESTPNENTPKYEIFDGLFLTAARIPRYLEVRTLLDEAVKSRVPVYFGLRPIPFTSSMQPEEALMIMLEQPTRMLEEQTRPEFFTLLSCMSEEQLDSP